MVDRWKLDHDICKMVADKKGAYVGYTDYAKLEKKNKTLELRLTLSQNQHELWLLGF